MGDYFTSRISNRVSCLIWLYFHGLKREYVGKSDGSYVLLHPNTSFRKVLATEAGRIKILQRPGI